MATYTEVDVTDYVWVTWVESHASSSGTTATYTDSGSTTTSSQASAWSAWADSGGTSTATYTDNQETVWRIWSGKYTYKVQSNGQVVYVSDKKKHSVEEARAAKAQRELDRIWRDLLIKEQEEEKQQAEDTALVLLGELVSPVELEHYKQHGEILVRGKKADYLVRKQAGVIKLEKDKVTSLCVHLKENYAYPPTDNTIAMKLLIEGEEKEFNKIANHSNLNGGDTDYWKRKVKEILEKYTENRRVA